MIREARSRKPRRRCQAVGRLLPLRLLPARRPNLPNPLLKSTRRKRKRRRLRRSKTASALSWPSLTGGSMENTKAVFFHSLFALGSLWLAIQAQASRVTASDRSLRLAEIAATETVCAAQVPSGWIKVDDAWNPTTCGNPTTKTYNVWIIREYAGEPIGAVMTVCNGRAPEGWVV